MLHQRVAPFLDEINTEVSDSVLIVSHANIIEEIILWWLELQLEMRRKIAFETAPCSITVLRLNDWKQRTIVFLNNTAHLDSVSSKI